MLISDIDSKGLCEFYEKQMKENILPFWLNRAIDEQYGGYYTSFDNLGNNLISTDKFTWSQGRFVWVFSQLSTMDIFNEEEKEQFIKLARSGAEFLMKNCQLENGNCTFLMDRYGNKKLFEEFNDYDISSYADCFVVCGLAKFGEVTQNTKTMEFAKQLYKSIWDRVQTNNFKTIPYSTPEGYKAHGIPMIMLNLSDELSTSLFNMGDSYGETVKENGIRYMKEIMEDFLGEDDLIHEMVAINKKDTDSLFDRYINPGHTIEDMWFVIHFALKINDLKTVDKAVKVIKDTFKIGWDNKYGGMYTYIDKDGVEPQGSIGGYENDLMVNKIKTDWDHKLWWPQSETLYASLLGYALTSDDELLNIYKKVHKYTFSTFPNQDKKIGEWVQIRDRKGEPVKKVVALPVKDPYHILRNYILIINLLKSTEEFI